MKIAVEGCAHGELEKIYDTIAYLEEKEGVKVDLLICCGDFQSTRNNEDLNCMAVPACYRNICSFYKYYSGEKIAPILTIFIGGNHEASNYLSELAYGGWVAPNIYYLGYAGVIQVAGIRIAGLSGIFKGRDYTMGHFEKAPFCNTSMRSVYHIRNLEVFRLKQLSGKLDVALSHDWPRGVCHHGNMKRLLKCKPFFEDDIKNNCLGSQPAEELLHLLKPTYWFSAHLHIKFSALIRHMPEDEDEDDSNITTTKFLSLDKCLPKRAFLQIVDIPHDEDKEIALEYDLEWISILSLTNHLLSVKKSHHYMPGPGGNGRWVFTPTKEEMDFVRKKFSDNLKIPMNFTQTVEAYSPSNCTGNKQPTAKLNPQTTSFCNLLGIDDPIALLLKHEGKLTTAETSFQSSKTLPSVAVKTEEGQAVSSKPTLLGMKLPLPKLSGLVLPPPKHNEEMSLDCVNSEVIEKKEEIVCSEPTAENPIIESRTPAPADVAGNSTQGPRPKKFKRRNQALYSSTDNDV